MGPSLASLCPDRCRGLSADPGADLTALTARLRGRRCAAPGTTRTAAAHRARCDRSRSPTCSTTPTTTRRCAPACRWRCAPRSTTATPRRCCGCWPPPRVRVPVGPARLLRRPLRRRVRGDAAAVAARHAAGRPSASRATRARAARLRVRAVRRRGRLRGRDRPLPALAGPGQPPRALGGAYPAVPTLILQGQEDLRTPPEVSAHVATLIAGTQRVTVPGVGHAVIGADPSGCGRRQLLRFVAGEPVRSAARASRPTCRRRACRRRRSGAPARGRAGRARGRTVSAVDATLDYLDFALSPALGLNRAAAGCAAAATASSRGSRCARFVVVPGVRISGSTARRDACAARARCAAAARLRARHARRAAAGPAGRPARRRAAGEPAAAAARVLRAAARCPRRPRRGRRRRSAMATC